MYEISLDILSSRHDRLLIPFTLSIVIVTFNVNISRHDADFAFSRFDNAGAVRTN